jgi:peptide/nickel transport system ATP-binding protein
LDTLTHLLDVRNLSVTYMARGTAIRAIRGLTFSLSHNEILGVVGASGSGKSSIAYSIMNLLPRNSSASGEVNFHGRNILGLRYSKLRELYGNKISLVFQDPTSALNPTMRVGAQVAEVIAAHRKVGAAELREEVLSLLTAAGLPSRVYDQYPHELSGGTRQRVVICIAVANRPELIIADEPTTNLDVVTQAQILGLITRVGRSPNTSSIIITHDLAVAAQTCDRVLVMQGGVQQECSDVLTVFQNPKSPVTRDLLENMIRVDRKPGRRRDLLVTRVPGEES